MTSKARELAKIADEDGDVTVTRNLDASSGTIKLDGNYPVGTSNVALGNTALDDGSLTGPRNTAIGDQSLTDNTSGQLNTGVGSYSLWRNTTGQYNNAIGDSALAYNTTGSNNTAVGRGSLENNTTGGNNVAVGLNALLSNTTASANTAVGYTAGYGNTTGAFNTFLGRESGYATTTGSSNTFVGANAGESVSTGTKNSILGRYNGNQNGLDIRTSSNNIVLSGGDGIPRMHFSGTGTVYILDETGGTIFRIDTNGRILGDGVGSFSAGQTFGDSVDMNDLKFPGLFRVDSGASNLPTASYYAVIVFGNGTNVTSQIATQLASTATFVRSFNTSWTSWVRLDT